MTAWMDATMWAVYGWYGIRPGDRMARFWGRPLSGIDRLQRKFADRVLRQRRLDAFEVTPERSRAFFTELREWNPKYAYGYPTLLRAFAEHLRGAGSFGRALDLKVVITTGELLDSSTRDSLEEFFGCPVANEYGCSESGVLAFECPAGKSHLIPVAAHSEVVDDRGRVLDRGQGKVLVTDLFGDVMPFVRYHLNDLARFQSAEKCECGRELPRLKVISGREGAFIRTPDGERLYSAILAYSVPREVAHFQVRQTDLDRLRADVVLAENVNDGTVLEECRERWERAVGGGLEVDVRAVDSIERGSSGKWRYFIPLGDQDRGNASGPSSSD